jgi:hypothetical protein
MADCSTKCSFSRIPQEWVDSQIKKESSEEKIRNTLSERESQYGCFEDVARTVQIFKDMIRGSGANLSNVQAEGLDMISHKIARIINGNPNNIDSWIDIAGYAQLVVDNQKHS